MKPENQLQNVFVLGQTGPICIRIGRPNYNVLTCFMFAIIGDFTDNSRGYRASGTVAGCRDNYRRPSSYRRSATAGSRSTPVAVISTRIDIDGIHTVGGRCPSHKTMYNFWWAWVPLGRCANEYLWHLKRKLFCIISRNAKAREIYS